MAKPNGYVSGGPPRVVARFPIILPVRCPACGDSLEMTAPTEFECKGCGATQRRLARASERLRAALEPDEETVEKAARRIYRLTSHNHWDDLSPARKRQLRDSVAAVIKTLKEQL